MMDKSSDKLQIEIAKQVLKNPILLASGTAGFGYDIADVLDISQLGGIVTKTITLEPRDGNPPPRIWETPSGMLNSIGLANPGLEAFIKDIVPLLADLPTEIIVSVGGNSEEEFIELVEKISEIEFVNTIELNLSCPNVKEGGIHFGRNPNTVFSLLKKLREITEKSLWAKLSPQVTDIAELGIAAQDGGADAISLINTLPAMAIDIKTRKPMLGAITGGLSGPAIHPVAVAMVYELSKKIGIPIIGIGGVYRPKDAVELIIAGASAVQIGSGYFADTTLPQRTVSFLDSYISRNEFDNVVQIVGSVKI